MDVVDRVCLQELNTLATKETNKRRFIRIRTVILAREGGTAVAIAAALGTSRRAVQRAVARYNAEGLDGFDDRPRPGQPRKLSDDQIDRFRQRIEAGPTSKDGVCSLRGKEIRSILEHEFGVVYSMPGVYVLLHRLGYSCLQPRPKHRKSDPEAKEEFKKK
jgi:transposase